MTTLQRLHRLEKRLSESSLPQASAAWSGADVIIADREPQERRTGMFADDDRYVITEHALEISWLFERLRDAFHAENRIDHCSKFEFYGRLANAALRCIELTGSPGAHKLYAAVLHEAFAIYDEMEEGAFGYLEIAIGGQIWDDCVDPSQRKGYVSDESTAAFFEKRGVKIRDVLDSDR